MKRNERVKKNKAVDLQNNIDNHTNVIRARKEKDLVQIENQFEDIQDKIDYLTLKLDGGLKRINPVFEYEKSEKLVKYETEQHEKMVEKLKKELIRMQEVKEKVLADIEQREKYIEQFQDELKSIKPDYVG